MSLTQLTPATPYADVNLTVHNYVHNSTVLSRATQDNLLSQGRRLAQDAQLTLAGWRNAKTASSLKHSLEPKTKTVYRLAYLPPSRPSLGVELGICDLKEWDSVVTQDEIFNLNDLDEFVNTDLRSIFHGIVRQERRSEPPNPVSEKSKRSSDSVLESQPKRRKLETGALYGFIPKPHVYPSPFCSSLSPPRGKPYEKTEPIFIAPYLTFSLPDDTRVAWLIPIRGILPWENCTSAVVLDSPHVLPIPTSAVVDDQISWTQNSILKFWDFLLRLRNAGKLGPLGISFNCSPQSRISPTTTNVEHRTDFLFLNVATTTTTADASSYLQGPHHHLSMVDYIKVFHDASSRLHVRNALDAWSYEVRDVDDSVKKIRILKGARLVLVDARSGGIQIS